MAVACLGFFLPEARAEQKELGWIERSSVEGILAQFGHDNLRVVSGYKEAKDDPDDGPGWYITARCKDKKTDEDYNASLWVSDDWKKGRVISVRKRE